MYPYDSNKHNAPHIHAFYGGSEAVFAIDNGNTPLEGSLPKTQTKRVLKWINIHKDELKECWDLAVNGNNPFSYIKIEPLS